MGAGKRARVWTAFSNRATSLRRCSTSVAKVGDVVTPAMDGGLGAATSMTLSASSASCSNPVPFGDDAKTIRTFGERR